MSDLIKLIESKSYVEAEKIIKEQATETAKAKLFEMKKMVAARMCAEKSSRE